MNQPTPPLSSLPQRPRLRLGVNIDHVATIRNARGGDHPDPVRAAQIVAEEQSRIVGSEQILETVTGLYSQVEGRFFHNRLTVLGGVRYEKTHDKGVGPLNDPSAVWVRDPDGTLLEFIQLPGKRDSMAQVAGVGT